MTKKKKQTGRRTIENPEMLLLARKNTELNSTVKGEKEM
jgi:hypothetical protein